MTLAQTRGRGRSRSTARWRIPGDLEVGPRRRRGEGHGNSSDNVSRLAARDRHERRGGANSRVRRRIMIAKWLRTIISCADQFWQSEAKLCSSFNAPYCAVLSMRHKAWGTGDRDTTMRDLPLHAQLESLTKRLKPPDECYQAWTGTTLGKFDGEFAPHASSYPGTGTCVTDGKRQRAGPVTCSAFGLASLLGFLRRSLARSQNLLNSKVFELRAGLQFLSQPDGLRSSSCPRVAGLIAESCAFN
jgi:hypothetical protein